MEQTNQSIAASTWKQRIQEWQESGKSMAAWCKEHHLPVSSFYYWKSTLQKKLPEVTKDSFMQLKERSSCEPCITVVINGISILVPVNFDEQTLLSCIRILKRVSC